MAMSVFCLAYSRISGLVLFVRGLDHLAHLGSQFVVAGLFEEREATADFYPTRSDRGWDAAEPG